MAPDLGSLQSAPFGVSQGEQIMREYRKGSHTVYDLNYHFVWITKYRYPVLRGDLATRVRDIVREVCMACDVRILKGVVSKDHIHLLVSCPPTMAPSKLAQLMKGKSSFRIQQEFPEIRKRYWGQHIWARGFFCASMGTVTEEMIKAYIEHHGAHSEGSDGFEVEK
jgi:putative transposase